MLIRLEHKDGLREIHLARNLHHLIVGQSFSLRKHRQRIARKRFAGENVELNETMVAQCLLSSFLEMPGHIIKASRVVGQAPRILASGSSIPTPNFA